MYHTLSELVFRDKENRIQWGMHHLTPRHKEGRVYAYQMSCHLEHHNADGKSCSRELSVNLAGSEENARRVLKAWVLWGHCLEDRQSHMMKTPKERFFEALQQGTLLSEAELDSIAVSSADDTVAAPFAEATVPTPLPTPKSKAKRKPKAKPAKLKAGSSLLGMPAEGVSQSLHEEMEQLALQGGIPCSTPQQRLRNTLTAKTSYHVPKPLLAALNHGYLHPNLPPPRGFVWQYHGGTWKLQIRGG